MYQLNHQEQWDTDFFHTLMSEKRIISSKEAKEIRRDLNDAGALPHLDNNFDWAMLCIAYCYAKKLTSHPDNLIPAPNAGGLEIPSFQTCFQDYAKLWLAVLSETLFALNPDKKVGKDDLYALIQTLWHTGAVELEKRWLACKEYRKDSDLAARQTFLNELVEMAVSNAGVGMAATEEESEAEMPIQDVSARLKNTFLESGFNVKELEFGEHGIRYDIYRLRLNSYTDYEKKHKELCAALGCPESALHIAPCHNGESFAFDVKFLRPENTWKHPRAKEFAEAVKQLPKNMILPICVGLNETGSPCFEDLAGAPHLLIGGTTGSGKSVLMRTLLRSLFEGCKGKDMLEVAILDPKKVDYRIFENEEDLWQGGIIDDYEEMYQFLSESVDESERRYELMKQHGVEKLSQLPENIRPNYRVIVIDELSNLLTNKKSINDLLDKLAEKARASGIHLILSTQRPSADVLNGKLRSNVPSRIALGVQKSTESKIIMDETGAELLLGKGDHLVKWVGKPAYFQHGFDL